MTSHVYIVSGGFYATKEEVNIYDRDLLSSANER